MSQLHFCPHCQQNVKPTKKFSVGIFLLLGFLTLGLGAFIYLLYYACKASTDCPICGAYVMRNPAQPIQPTTPPKAPLLPPHNYCPYCGEILQNPKNQFCGSCGAALD